MKKKLLITFGLAGIIAASVAVGAYAASDIKLFINGKLINTDLQIVDGSSYVPLKVVSESLGAEVKWDGDKREIHIGKENDPTAIGLSRSNPAPLKSKVSYFVESMRGKYEASFNLEEVIRGDKALKMVKDANQFNGEPGPTQEYLLAKVTVNLTKNLKAGTKIDFSSLDFTMVSGSGRDYPNSIVVKPSPALDTSLYEGASNTGWLVFIVDKNDDSPLLTFARDSDGSDGIWLKTK